MSRDKQIEEMAKIIADCEICIYRGDVIWKEEDVSDNLALCIARALNEQGYRKASDVAREIFAEIERKLTFIRDADTDAIRGIVTIKDITILKKKYESEGADDEIH